MKLFNSFTPNKSIAIGIRFNLGAINKDSPFIDAYSRRVFSGRKIELMLEENLPMMVLAEHQKISYHTINNFRSSKHANQLIKKSFLYFTNLLE